MNKKDKLALGSFYTNNIISDYISEKVWKLVNKKIVSVIDPAMGNGNLLFSLTKNVLAEDTINIILAGYDINGLAIKEANERFQSLSFKTIFKERDSLLLIDELNTKKYDVLVSNPPWGAKINFSKKELREIGYVSANNQYDSYDLFIELSLKIVKKGGIIAFILPDSIFLKQHKQIRKKILEETTLLTIYKLGEGFFEGVHRSTVILIIKNEKFKKNHEVETIVLRKEARQKIFSNELQLIDYEDKTKKVVLQQRFLNNDFLLNIEENNEKDSKILEHLKVSERVEDYFLIGRGIEISKNGELWFCSKCNYYKKKSKNKIECCPNCDTELELKSIIKKNYQPGYIPIVVGEDFKRYSTPEPRYIAENIDIINYKTNKLISHKNKILVRKTGLGITATMDKDRVHTNQVVFHLIPKTNLSIQVLLGILNSRIMLFFHLKQSGETEWKSHPYITQTIIKELPLPNIVVNIEALKELDRLVDLIVSNGYSKEIDLQVEKQILILYGLNIDDLIYINGYIKSIDQLKVISKMVLTEVEIEQIDRMLRVV